jgi:hypothetical protein
MFVAQSRALDALPVQHKDMANLAAVAASRYARRYLQERSREDRDQVLHLVTAATRNISTLSNDALMLANFAASVVSENGHGASAADWAEQTSTRFSWNMSRLFVHASKETGEQTDQKKVRHRCLKGRRITQL